MFVWPAVMGNIIGQWSENGKETTNTLHYFDYLSASKWYNNAQDANNFPEATEKKTKLTHTKKWLLIKMKIRNGRPKRKREWEESQAYNLLSFDRLSCAVFSFHGLSHSPLQFCCERLRPWMVVLRHWPCSCITCWFWLTVAQFNFPAVAHVTPKPTNATMAAIHQINIWPRVTRHTHIWQVDWCCSIFLPFFATQPLW